MSTDNNRNAIRDSYDSHADEWTTRIRSGRNWAHEHIEKPAMARLAHDVARSRTLLVGCGSGEEVAVVDAPGNSIVGIDLSPRLVANAASAFPQHEFLVADFDALPFPGDEFDFVYSSLAFHYSDNLLQTLCGVRRVMRTGATLLFSMHHPLLWSSQTIREGAVSVRKIGYTRNAETGEAEVNGDYFGSRWVDDVWFGNMPVRYFHQPLETTLGAVMGAGFRMTGFFEPRPTDGNGVNFDIYSKLPPFMVVKAVAE